MGQTSTKPETNLPPSASTSTITTRFKPRKHLSRVELVSIQYVFRDLKSTFKDSFECIEAKQFLEHLHLPSDIEPAGVLLFKAFSYLGSYPACTASGPVPLSFDAFIAAFVVLIGRLDKDGDPISESMFFRSLSILPSPQEEEEKQVNKPSNEDINQDTMKSTGSKGLSLAELGVDFDVDFDTKNSNEGDTENNASDKILCRDLVELFVLLLWLGQVDKQDEIDLVLIRETANKIVSNIQTTATTDELPCISYQQFCYWKDRFSPHLFKPLQSFIIRSFAYYDTNTSLLKRERVLPEDATPEPDTTDILSPLHTTLLSWSLPEPILVTKQWTRLYSANKDGFSMNRFESHVFKYPGPTLLVIKANASGQELMLGAYIAQAWKHSKHFWGNDQCFLFELHPSFDIYRSVLNRRTGQAQNDHYIYYHHEFGIGFGATSIKLQPQGFIVYLRNSLQQGGYQHEAYPSQPSLISATKSKEHLQFSFQFDTEDIEVFGLGSEKDRERQAREWKFEKQEAERRASLNMRQSDGNLDKELLKMAGIIDENRQER
ncbi:TLD-domain-containing protein [Gilbertella persicaria]|uniref:TLD-domain-containing protein n=1 Tax=Gilbertella persicaria TaxID=101096 RepID=UPI002220FB41|nr:TLD-domain-containing protein [Gilbertella persicaria]KAI8049146.1 TLD-domain-containing protein [Gilbertella persicaria]